MSKEILTKIPGIIDPHVHFRDLNQRHKETFETGTRAAIGGGVVAVLDMPNNDPQITSPEMFARKQGLADDQAVCDWGLYYGASNENVGQYERIIKQVFGLKMFLNATTGMMLLEDPKIIWSHLSSWPYDKPILVHAEGPKVKDIIDMVEKLRRPVHLCHISLAEEMKWVREAKEAGLPITCEVTPHHLFLTEQDARVLGSLGMMKPGLKTACDVDALWQGIYDGVVDTIGSDHAPHTLDEKKSENPPFGVPGVETTLPLLLTAVAQGKLTLEQVVRLTHTNPAIIFKIKPPEDSYVLVNLSERSVIDNSRLRTKCGWSPFAGKEVIGTVKEVYLRGQRVFDGENVSAQPGSGRELIYVAT